MTMQHQIESKLAEIAPLHLEVINESGQHNVPPGAESHFKIVVVAGEFAGQSRLARHRRVHAILAEELAGGIHALALHAYAPDEWAADSKAPASPPCLGGSKKKPVQV